MAAKNEEKSLKILTFPLGQLQANCYFLILGKSCLIIDPADDASFILEEVQRRGLEITGLLATHGHFDHVMAAGEIQAALPHVPFYIHDKDEFLIRRLRETAKHFLGYEPHILPPHRMTSLNIGKLKITDFELEVLHTPGHTPGSVCYHFPTANLIFTGDTLFAGAIGRYDFSYSDKAMLKESLKKILALFPKTNVYPGHGEATTVENEKDSLQKVI